MQYRSPTAVRSGVSMPVYRIHHQSINGIRGRSYPHVFRILFFAIRTGNNKNNVKLTLKPIQLRPFRRNGIFRSFQHTPQRQIPNFNLPIRRHNLPNIFQDIERTELPRGRYPKMLHTEVPTTVLQPRIDVISIHNDRAYFRTVPIIIGGLKSPLYIRIISFHPSRKRSLSVKQRIDHPYHRFILRRRQPSRYEFCSIRIFHRRHFLPIFHRHGNKVRSSIGQLLEFHR